jgi:quercetin dioxygenase-like cupin family protein
LGKTDKNIENKIIYNSLGLLNENEKQQLKSDLENFSGIEKKMISEFNNLVSLIPKTISATNNKFMPSPKVKEKLFKKIASVKSTDANIHGKGFDFIYADSNDWIQHPDIDGIKVKQLAVNKDKDYLVLLLKVAANTEYPSHHHSSSEECYVIEGDVYAQGKILGPGDFHHADSGSDHDTLYTKNGCTLLLVVDPKDY